ncbi:hypothetical protein [Nocardia niwae]|uniref:hypothetical protein n=1 Tax=Nocardia niwae TaxID=626084 RepID=UPI0033D73EC9
MAKNLDSIATISVRLLGRDRHAFRQLLVNEWQYMLDDLSISESEAFTAAILLVTRAAKPQVIRDEAAKKGMSEEETERLLQANKWYMEEFIEQLRAVIEQRSQMDGRKKRAGLTELAS